MTFSTLSYLIYYADIWHVVLYNKFLVKDKFLAKVFYPGSETIIKKTNCLGPHSIVTENLLPVDFDIHNYDNEIKLHIKTVVDRYYSDIDGTQLLTNIRSEYPWILARRGYQDNEKCDKEINKRICRIYYRGLYKLIEKCEREGQRNP